MRTLILAALLGACSTDHSVGTDQPGVVYDDDCGLADAAFCATFEQRRPGGRGGDLDEQVFSFSRFTRAWTLDNARVPARTHAAAAFPSTFCGGTYESITPPGDIRFCEGVGPDGNVSLQLHEVFDDGGDFGLNSLRIRQPFDFSGRVGTVAWDVDAKTSPNNLGHTWWIEAWITEDPAPLPTNAANGSFGAVPRNALGVLFRTGADCDVLAATPWANGMETVVVVTDGQATSTPFWELPLPDARCFRAADNELNHLELRVSTTRVELWVSDADDPGSFTLRSTADVNLPFTRGYVHLQHGAFDAAKDGADSSQTFRWDRIAFDGPVLPRPRSYEIPDNTELLDGIGQILSYPLRDGAARSFVFSGVERGAATQGALSRNKQVTDGQDAMEYRFNANAWHAQTVPASGASGMLVRGIVVDVPVAELVDGDNVLEVRIPSPEGHEHIANIDLMLSP